jgi:hypothetical protein
MFLASRLCWAICWPMRPARFERAASASVQQTCCRLAAAESADVLPSANRPGASGVPLDQPVRRRREPPDAIDDTGTYGGLEQQPFTVRGIR